MAEFIAGQSHDDDDYDVDSVGSRDFDALAAHDAETWQASRIRQMTEMEFEGIPTPIHQLDEGEELEAAEKGRHNALVHDHNVHHPDLYLSAPQAHAVEETLKDIEQNSETVHEANHTHSTEDVVSSEKI